MLILSKSHISTSITPIFKKSVESDEFILRESLFRTKNFIFSEEVRNGKVDILLKMHPGSS